VGANPLGLTNCLNFGNPEKPTVAWQLTKSVEALTDVCKALDLPVVGGNVSLYNETSDGPIYPTPVVGVVGELADATQVPGQAFEAAQTIALVGPFAPSLAGSELVKLRGELDQGLPGVEISEIAAAQGAVRDSVSSADGLTACHDISDGGLACAIAEMAIAGETGAECDLDGMIDARGCSGETALFGEGPGGFIVAGSDAALEALASRGVEVIRIGSTGGTLITIAAAERSVALSLADATTCWRSLEGKMV
jgi:phosphoribosylformylglycinamidine synthase